MRKLLLSLIFLTLFFPAMSQGWASVSGTVTDSLLGFPVPGHAVTIMTDSTYGTFYYNVVYTDSAGYYYDDVPVMADTMAVIYVFTFDCNGTMHQVMIIYSPSVSNYTQDFQICTENTVEECHAAFEFRPEPSGSPDSYQFTDLSTGNIDLWLWEFGDGTISEEPNPYHQFPGPGTFNICLTVTSNNCMDTYCLQLVISDTVYMQIYGQVFAGNFPLQHGKVMIFAINPSGAYTPLNEGCVLDSNGIYFFTLVPQGNYLVQAVPFDSTAYLPTYYGDVTGWTDATLVVPEAVNDPFNINMLMVPAGMEYFGAGSLSGQINSLGMQRSMVDNTFVLLKDENLVTLGYTWVSSSGHFEFPSLDYGIYHIRTELAGVSSDNLKFEISQETPHLDVVLNYNGNSILGMEDELPGLFPVSLYPNPASGLLNISVKLPGEISMNLELVSMSGQTVYATSGFFHAGHEEIVVNTSDLPAGIYSLKISSESGMVAVKKILIVK